MPEPTLFRQEREDDLGLLGQVQPHDLIRFGFIPEFVGRLPVTATLGALDEGALVEILAKPKNSLVKQYQKLFEYENIELILDPLAMKAIAKLAMERNVGARGPADDHGRADAGSNVLPALPATESEEIRRDRANGPRGPAGVPLATA